MHASTNKQTFHTLPEQTHKHSNKQTFHTLPKHTHKQTIKLAVIMTKSVNHKFLPFCFAFNPVANIVDL